MLNSDHNGLEMVKIKVMSQARGVHCNYRTDFEITLLYIEILAKIASYLPSSAIPRFHLIRLSTNCSQQVTARSVYLTTL